MASSFDSFGRIDRRNRAGQNAQTVLLFLPDADANTLLPFGNGRSYGDTCHNDSGRLADFRPLNRILAFDPATGVLEAEAGVMLHQVIDTVARHGWFLPVTPGTRHVTLGGAVANDVHGKNHHRRGTFGCHVLGLELARSDTGSQWLDAADSSRLYRATVGGMGLTGMIKRVRLRLMKVPSLDIAETVTPFRSLDDYFGRAEDADAANEYAVAWLDQLSAGGETRGVLLAGNHAGNGNFVTGSHKPRISVPFDLPFNALNPLSLRAFNEVFYRSKARKAGRVLTSRYQGYFYPLDAVGHWNRLYGPKGLFQHQSVIPFETARQAIPELLAASRRTGEASFLTVLKRFGDIASPGLMSFPVPGFTLTLDFPNRGGSTLRLLDELDRITIEAGGRVNPYKDARMSAETFAASFPQWRELEACRDPALMSDFWRRTAGQLSESGNADNFSAEIQPALTAAQ
jgi:FAD/FMN-containing dehydrogenase